MSHSEVDWRRDALSFLISFHVLTQQKKATKVHHPFRMKKSLRGLIQFIDYELINKKICVYCYRLTFAGSGFCHFFVLRIVPIRSKRFLISSIGYSCQERSHIWRIIFPHKSMRLPRKATNLKRNTFRHFGSMAGWIYNFRWIRLISQGWRKNLKQAFSITPKFSKSVRSFCILWWGKLERTFPKISI